MDTFAAQRASMLVETCCCLFTFAVLALLLLLTLFIWWWARQKQETTLPLAPAEPEPPTLEPEPAEPALPPPAESPPAPEAVEPEPVAPDDLKRINGIGPKIASLLQAAGIITFAHLAATDVSRLKQILEEAELQHLADPSTWPEQAMLASAGDWDGFDALRAELKGGRRA